MSDTRIDGNPENKFSIPFREMAERIERGLAKEFAGAMLLVPPEGDPIAIMLTDPSRDLDNFMAMCRTKIEIAATAQQTKHLQGNGYLGRR